jgi:D-sedoheptulose 7-phosphate isomerase
VARALADVYQRGGRLFTIGNGGSSCDAAHIAVEFLHPITAGRPAWSALTLGADIAMLTATMPDSATSSCANCSRWRRAATR